MHATSTRRQVLAGGTVALGLAGLTGTVATLAESGVVREATTAVGGDGERPGPNIVVVLADDLGWGELGSYGQRLISTPRLDQLAAEGMRFTSAYAPAPVCAPSRCSMLTGLHSGHATVRNNPLHGAQASLGEEDTTFAEILRERGYRTACFGKWGFGPEEPNQPSHPNNRGFEEFYGYVSHGRAHDFYPTMLWENDKQVALPANKHGRRAVYAPDLFRQRALDYVTRRASADEPFLLYVAPNTPHAPSRYLEHASYASRSWSAANKGHAAQISHLDGLVGDLVDLLVEKDLAEDTIVLVSSDNGPHEEAGVNPERFDANGGLRGYKRNLYEGGIRVPLIAWAPGRVSAGTETDRRTPLTDLLPTLAELGGAEVPEDLDGMSIAGLVTGGERPGAHPYLYWYRNDPHTTPRSQAADRGRGARLCEALRQGDWKLVRFAPGRHREIPDHRWQVELYNLRQDPAESQNVADQHPDLVRRMMGLLREAWTEPVPVAV
ncbi:arylsulfatase [Streptomyces oceani]|uniref:Sulfatase N-terminal domain-containing protein n=1 Tax=Streptomyces oceani TaxID=1075402 RepID=A0A1E7KJX5_9ACTN|nr:arylsulfatase [Streptomyces oceani]OEV04279.1 hypothetical protein AN216_08800 [Streptomyces oceani]